MGCIGWGVAVEQPGEESLPARLNGCLGLSSAPAMKPSSEVDTAVKTLAMPSSLPEFTPLA